MFKRSLFLAAFWMACSSSLWAQAPSGGYGSYYDRPSADDDARLSSQRRLSPARRPTPATVPTSRPVTADRDDDGQPPARRYVQQRRVQQAAVHDNDNDNVNDHASKRVRATSAIKMVSQDDTPPPPPPADLQAAPTPQLNGGANQFPSGAGTPVGSPYDGPWNGAPSGMNPGMMGCDDGCENCGGCGCDECGGSCRRLIYARAEYLSWWIRGDSPPPLVTSGPAGTAQSDAGQLGQPGTTVLFGGNPINNRQRSGARLTLGMWLSPVTRLEGEWFGLGPVTSSFNASSDGSTILARPFFNMNPTVLAQDAKILGYPSVFAGSVHVSETSRFMGAGINATYNVLSTECGMRQRRVDFIYGFRYLRLSEGLSINDQTNSLSNGGLVPAGTTFNTSDSFRTTNNFYGLNLGVMSENRFNRWGITTIGRFALGSTAERVNINGATTVTSSSGAGATYAGGLLTQPTNIGSYHHDAFTVAPQLEMKLSYYFRPNLRALVGYDLLYWSNVARPGAQVNTNVNTTQATGGTLTGPSSPSFTFHQTDLWAQGVSLGAEWTF